MRRIWGLLNELIKITFPFAPDRWTWETDSICIRARNWWNDLCFSQEQIPDPSRAWDGSLFKVVVSIGMRMVPSHPEDIYLYCISWMGNGNLEATIGMTHEQLVCNKVLHSIWRNLNCVWVWKELMECCLINSQEFV